MPKLRPKSAPSRRRVNTCASARPMSAYTGRIQAARPNVVSATMMKTLTSMTKGTGTRSNALNTIPSSLAFKSKPGFQRQQRYWQRQRQRQHKCAPSFSHSCSVASMSAQLASTLTASRALLRDSPHPQQRSKQKSKYVSESASNKDSARALLGNTQHEPTGVSFTITTYGEGRSADAKNLRCALQRCNKRIASCPLQDDVPHTPLLHALPGRQRQRNSVRAHSNARKKSSRFGRVLEWRASAEARDIYLDHLQLHAVRRNYKRCKDLNKALELSSEAVVAWHDSRHREVAAHEAEAQAVADADFAAAHPLAAVMAGRGFGGGDIRRLVAEMNGNVAGNDASLSSSVWSSSSSESDWSVLGTHMEEPPDAQTHHDAGARSSFFARYHELMHERQRTAMRAQQGAASKSRWRQVLRDIRLARGANKSHLLHTSTATSDADLPSTHSPLPSYTPTPTPECATLPVNTSRVATDSPPHAGNAHVPGLDLSPRSKTLNAFIACGVRPLPLVLRRDKDTAVLDLNGRGLGDDIMLEVGDILASAPGLTGFHIGDNRLTDKSLAAVIDTLCDQSSIASLDVSRNEIGWRAAAALVHLLKGEEQTLADALSKDGQFRGVHLRLLNLSHMGMCDEEANTILRALLRNNSVQELILAHNRLGESERIVGTKSNTQSLSIADVLLRNKSLLRLDISWNMLSRRAILPVARALGQCRTLMELNLSYNACGDEGCQVLAGALGCNRTLQMLDLSSNNVSGKAMITFIHTLKRRRGKRLLVKLNGHSFSRQVARALMRLMSSQGARSSYVQLAECTFDGQDKELFDISEPTGEYHLDMSSAYDRAVASELLDLVRTRAEYVIEPDSMVYVGLTEHPVHNIKAKDGASLKGSICGVKIAVEKVISTLATAHNQKETCSAVRTWLAATATAAFAEIAPGYPKFNEMDAGQMVEALEKTKAMLSRKAFVGALDNLSIPEDKRCAIAAVEAAIVAHSKMSTSQALQIIIDRNACSNRCEGNASDISADDVTIDDMAFVEEAVAELLRQPPLAIISGGEMDWCKAEGLPTTGELSLRFRNRQLRPVWPNRTTPAVITALLERLQQTSGAPNLDSWFCAAVGIAGDRFAHAAIYGDLHFDAADAERVLTTILPGSFEKLRQACMQKLVRFVCSLLHTLISAADVHSFVRAVFGPNDIANVSQRMQVRQQLGELFRPIFGNSTGHYSLDLSFERDRLAFFRLIELSNTERERCCLAGRWDSSQWPCGGCFRNCVYQGKPNQLGKDFFDNLPTFGHLEFDFASIELESPQTKPITKAEFADVIAHIQYCGSVQGIVQLEVLLTDKRLMTDHLKLILKLFPASYEPPYTVRQKRQLDTGRKRASNRMQHFTGGHDMRESRKQPRARPSATAAQIATPRSTTTTLPGIKSDNTAQDSMSTVPHDVLQADNPQSHMDEPLHTYAGPKPLLKHGIVSMRVRIILLVWGRIVDKGNMRTMLAQVLTEQEWHEIVHRLGWVMLFNPTQPDGKYFFNLKYQDHRQLVIVLVDLMSNEKGELLWSEERFQHSRGEEPVSGQQMRAMRGRWQMDPDRVPRQGFFNMTYSSDPRKGCVPNHDYRQKLARAALVLSSTE